MNAPPVLAISHLRARAPACEPVVSRLAAEALVAEVASALPPLPPQAVLMLRRLALALPGYGLDRLPDARLRQRFAATVRGAIAAAAATAGRPALGVIAADTAAVLFGDEAELLACLTRDGLAGSLDVWWWRSLLVGGYPDWTRAWVDRPHAAPAALRLLARAGLAEAAVQVLDARGALADGVVEAWRVGGEQGALQWPAASGDATSTPAGISTGALKPDAANVSEPLITPPPPVPAKSTTDEVGENRASQPPTSLASALRGPTPAAVTQPDTPQPITPGPTDTREPAPAGATHLDVYPPIPLHSPATGVETVRPAAAVDAAATSPGPIPPATPSEHLVASDVRTTSVATPGDRPPSVPDYRQTHLVQPERRADPTRPAVVLEPLGLPAEIARRFARLARAATRRRQAAATPASGHAVADAMLDSITTFDRPATPDHALDAMWTGPDAAAPLDAAPRVVVSGYARLFFLVNLLLGDGLYPDFTRPLDPGFPVPLWRLLALLGAELAGPALYEDAIWLLLDRLGAELPTRDEPWLEQLWPVPGDESGAKQPIGSPRSRAHGFTGWFRRYLASVRARLSPALGVRPARVGRVLAGEPARIWVSAAEIVVVHSLEHHPVEWRLAGLDRDPGYLPSAGRSLRFIFE